MEGSWNIEESSDGFFYYDECVFKLGERSFTLNHTVFDIKSDSFLGIEYINKEKLINKDERYDYKRVRTLTKAPKWFTENIDDYVR